MQYAKLIHEYLDEGIDSSREDLLFAELAANPEVREEFNRQVKLHLFAQNDMGSITPPIELTYGVFSQLGFSIPSENYMQQTADSVKPSKYSSALNFWKRNLTTMSIVLLLTSFSGYMGYQLATGKGIFGFGKTQSVDVAKSTIPVAGSFDSSDETQNSQHQKNNGETFASLNTYSNNSADSNPYINKSAKKQNTGNRSERYTENANNPAIGLTNDNSDLTKAHQTALNQVTVPLLAFSAPGSLYSENLGGFFQISSINKTSGSPILISNAYPGSIDSDGMFLNPGSIRPIDDTRFIIQVRGLNPEPATVYSNNVSSEPVIGKLSFAIFYKVNENSAFGIEAGWEHFSQVFDRKIGGKEFTQVQNPMLFWYGASYRYTGVELIIPDIFYPYGQALVGGTATGAIVRAQGGMQLKLTNNFVLLMGYEYRNHFFNVDNTIYSSTRHGLVYGVNFNF